MAALLPVSSKTLPIQVQSGQIEEFLFSCGLQSPSFDITSPSDLPLALHTARAKLLEAADELVLLVQGPLQSLTSLVGYSHNARNSIHAIVRFDLATTIPIDSTSTFEEVATARGLDSGDTTRILRHAMTYRVFSEKSPGVVAHTATSRLLVENPSLRGWITNTLDELLPAASRMVDAMERWPGSQEPNHTGWNLAHA
ncbi:hypothetical protein G7Y89_g15690 [Cudoniella acicularis]|uniref:Uncharacterized protein n=1 Tax=Cudoniella acicularis TaxID=354080 RepID=A0A8H4VIT7_9HELO|nr:hypothetical protein G7Y89_g15690 [Cudoniella acicularis]